MTQAEINRDWAYNIAAKRVADSQIDHTIWQDAKRGTYMVMSDERPPYPGTWNLIETIKA
jgi:hypothetical protein